MKNKIILYVAAYSIIPVLLCSLLFGLIGLEYWWSTDGGLLSRILKGSEINYIVLSILCIISVFGLVLILYSQLIFLRFIPKIDKLDEEFMSYFKAKEKYEEATFNFVKNIKNIKSKAELLNFYEYVEKQNIIGNNSKTIIEIIDEYVKSE